MTASAAHADAPLADRLRPVATPTRLDALLASVCVLGVTPARAQSLRAYAAAKTDAMAALARDLRAPDDETDPHFVATAALVDGLVTWLEAAVPDGALGRVGGLALELISRVQAGLSQGAATLALPPVP